MHSHRRQMLDRDGAPRTNTPVPRTGVAGGLVGVRAATQTRRLTTLVAVVAGERPGGPSPDLLGEHDRLSGRPWRGRSDQECSRRPHARKASDATGADEHILAATSATFTREPGRRVCARLGRRPQRVGANDRLRCVWPVALRWPPGTATARSYRHARGRRRRTERCGRQPRPVARNRARRRTCSHRPHLSRHYRCRRRSRYWRCNDGIGHRLGRAEHRQHDG